MRTYLYLALLVAATCQLQAQDTLYKADGSSLLVKILEVKTVQVKYKLFSDQDGPTYVIGRDYVLKVIYETGRIEVFPVKEPEEAVVMQTVDPQLKDFGRNFVAVDVFDLFNGVLTIGYEYTFKSGIYSLRMPLSIGIFETNFYRETQVFGTGLDFSFYPRGQREVSFFGGPSFEYKRFKFSNYTSELNSTYALLIQGGLLYQPVKHFNISFTWGLGYARFIRNDSFDSYGYGEIISRAGLNIGYKF